MENTSQIDYNETSDLICHMTLAEDCLIGVIKYMTDILGDISVLCLRISIRTIQYCFHYDTFYCKVSLIINVWTTETPLWGKPELSFSLEQWEMSCKYQIKWLPLFLFDFFLPLMHKAKVKIIK